MNAFDTALQITLGFEGGFSDHSADTGGRTNFGVTEKVYRRWREHEGKRFRPIEEITRAEVRAIYHAWYWVQGRCDELPYPLALAHFDACVNHGPLNAAKILQAALGVRKDGKIGPVTLTAVSDSGPSFLDDVLFARLEFYYQIVRRNQSQSVFLLGWLRRTLRLREQVEQAPSPTPQIQAVA